MMKRQTYQYVDLRGPARFFGRLDVRDGSVGAGAIQLNNVLTVQVVLHVEVMCMAVEIVALERQAKLQLVLR